MSPADRPRELLALEEKDYSGHRRRPEPSRRRTPSTQRNNIVTPAEAGTIIIFRTCRGTKKVPYNFNSYQNVVRC